MTQTSGDDYVIWPKLMIKCLPFLSIFKYLRNQNQVFKCEKLNRIQKYNLP
jgi:hypothetical protein